MPKTSLLNKEAAEQTIARIEDPAIRTAVSLLLKGVAEFYGLHPSRLETDFDLSFFVDVLRDRIDYVSGLIRGEFPVEYWFSDYPNPQPQTIDAATDSGQTGARNAQAFNYAATRSEERLQAALLALHTQANLKPTLSSQNVKRHEVHGGPPIVPGAPAAPFDFLFMLQAVEHALAPGQPARRFIEQNPKPVPSCVK